MLAGARPLRGRGCRGPRPRIEYVGKYIIYELRVWDTNKTMARSGIINVGRTYSKFEVGIKKYNFLGVV